MTKDNLRDYDDAFKLRVLSDYYQSGMSKSFISRKWGVSRPTFIRWKKLWPIDSKELSLNPFVLLLRNQDMVQILAILST